MTDLDQKVRGVRMYLAERAKMRQIDFDQIHGLHVGDAREAVLTATDLTAILDEYDRRGAALVEAEGALRLISSGRATKADGTLWADTFVGGHCAASEEPWRSAAQPVSVGREEWFFVAGPVWLEPELTDEDDNPIWTSEVQLHGGHAVVATVHGESEAQAVARRDAILAALGRTEATTPPAWQPIEAAPRDGTEFQAWWKGQWQPRARFDPEYGSFQLWGRTDCDTEGWECFAIEGFWQPLPTPPEGEG